MKRSIGGETENQNKGAYNAFSLVGDFNLPHRRHV